MHILGGPSMSYACRLLLINAMNTEATSQERSKREQRLIGNVRPLSSVALLLLPRPVHPSQGQAAKSAVAATYQLLLRADGYAKHRTWLS